MISLKPAIKSLFVFIFLFLFIFLSLSKTEKILAQWCNLPRDTCDVTFCGGNCCVCGYMPYKQIYAECKYELGIGYYCQKRDMSASLNCCSNWGHGGCKNQKGFEEDCVINRTRTSCSVRKTDLGLGNCNTTTYTPACSDTRDCGGKCRASGCDACACDGDSRSSAYDWSSLGCSSDCKTCYCGKLKCSCSWVNRSCGGGSCSSTERQQEYVCNNSSCSGHGDKKCVSDSSCCSCGGWTARGCGEGVCDSLQRRYTRTCNPSGCQAESECRNDSSCCTCTPWVNGNCGSAGNCPIGQRRQTRTCVASCKAESQCATDSYCNPYCEVSLSPSSLNIKTGNQDILTANIKLWNDATVKQVNFTPDDSKVATVRSPIFPPPSSQSSKKVVDSKPLIEETYKTYVYGEDFGETGITARTALNPSGSCTAPSKTNVSVESSSWFQTQEGNLHSQGRLSVRIPSNCGQGDYDCNLSRSENNSPGIISHQDNNPFLGHGFPSNNKNNHWLAESKYLGKPYGSYQFFKKKFAMELGSENYGSGRGDLPVEDGIYYAQSSRTLSGNWTLGADRWLVIMVEGDIRVSQNIIVPQGSFLTLVAKGNIIFDSTIEQAQGFFIADGDIETGSSQTQFKGEGLFAASRFVFGRDFDDERNRTTPAEYFTFRPDFLINSYKNKDHNLWWFFHIWQEIAP